MRKFHLTGSTAHLVLAAGLMACALPQLALAQSTATQQDDEIIVTASKGKTVGGLLQVEDAPKSRAAITDTFIRKQVAGQSVLASINILPGVTFNNNDPFGSSGGDIRIRGFEGNRISLTFDGFPLNDSGNAAIFSNQQLDPELVSRVSVNLGSTDVDSPTASSVGGTVNILTRNPKKELEVQIKGTVGSFSNRRIFGAFDTGEIGPFGTTAFFAASYTISDKFRGPGELEKRQYNFKVRQEIGEASFVSLAGNLNNNRNAFFRTLTFDQVNQGSSLENFAVFTRATPGAGRQDDAQGVANDPLTPASGANFFGVNINPSNTGSLRFNSLFKLSDQFTLTFDAAYQYVLANGGGSQVVPETDRRLRGTSTVAGVDLNGDGDTMDSVRLFAPNNTNTNRYNALVSLIFNIDEANRLRLSYAGDFARHRQTGEFSRINPDGSLSSVFGGRNGTPVVSADGNVLQRRNRFSIANLNQVSADYVGKFFDEAVTVSIGARVPFFKRKLNNFCFTSTAGSGTNGGDALCTTENLAASSTIARPFNDRNFSFDDFLPNLGINVRVADGHSVFAGYAQTLNVPSTDNFYDAANTLRNTRPDPETSKSYEVGYRLNKGRFIGSLVASYTKFENQIQTVFDPVEQISVSRNIGGTENISLEAQLGANITPEFQVVVSGAFLDTKLLDDRQLSATTVLFTRGLERTDTARYTFKARADYTTELFELGVQGIYTGERFTTDINDRKVPGTFVVDLNASINLDKIMGLKNSQIQFNVQNLFDEEGFGGIGINNNANTIPAQTVRGITSAQIAGNAANTGFRFLSPRIFQVSVQVGF